jgi:hypothetical protein
MHGEWGMIHTTRTRIYTAMSLGASHFEHAVGGRDLTWARRRDWDKELSRDASERERRKRAKKRIESFLKLTRAMACTTLPDFREPRVAPWENQKPAHETTRRHAPHLKFQRVLLGCETACVLDTKAYFGHLERCADETRIFYWCQFDRGENLACRMDIYKNVVIGKRKI